MKRCNRCKETKPLDAFAKNKVKRDGLQGMCRVCKKETDAEHYKNNKEKQLARNARLRRKYREEVSKLKNVPCTDCKVKYPWYVMDFDHIRGDKVGNISRMRGNVSQETLLTEIAKCEVVCANCHRIRTYQRASIA